MIVRINLAVVMILMLTVGVLGADLKKQDQQTLRKAFPKGRELFVIHPYFEGLGATYNVRPGSNPELKPLRGGNRQELRLLRGDKVIIEKVDAKGEYLELLIRTVEWKTIHFSPKDKFWGTVLLGLPGMAATQGDPKLRPDVRLRFFGKSADEVETLVSQFLSDKQPSTDLNPGMSPEEVLKILGDPTEIMNFANKKTFRYPKLDVIFVDEKLSEVLFRDPIKK